VEGAMERGSGGYTLLEGASEGLLSAAAASAISCMNMVKNEVGL